MRRVVHQKAKGPIDPSMGLRIKQLREARRMTQAELAGPDFSKGFISLLETGRTRISLRAGQIVARRLGVSVTDLLGDSTLKDERQAEFLTLRAEQELAAGRAAAALEIAAALERQAPEGILRVRIKRLRARALIETDRSRESVRLLDEARRDFERLARPDLVARTLFDLARAHARLDEPGEALSYALSAEQALLRGDVVDRTLELQIMRILVNIYERLGDYGSAALRGERALAIAEDVADPDALAKLYSSLALTRFEQKDIESAITYAKRALGLYETLGQKVAVAETWNTMAWLHVQHGHFSKAEEALGRAESAAKDAQADRIQPWIQSTRADLALARRDHARAVALAEAVAATPNIRPALRAQVLLTKARAIAAQRVPPARLRSAFEDALAAAKAEPAAIRARLHAAYAEALSERDLIRDAFEQQRQAWELSRPGAN